MDLIITCPKCDAQIDVSRQMTESLNQRIEEERSKLLAEERRKVAAEMKEQLRKAAEDAAKKAKKEEAARYEEEKVEFRKELVAKSKEVEKAKQEEAARYEGEKMKFRKELIAKSKEVERLLEQQEEKVREMAENRSKAEVQQFRAEIEKSYRERLGKKDLAIAEYQDKVSKAEKKAEELQARLSQGSPQTRGIIAERQLLEFLRENMPADRCEVEKRGQGKKGTDVIIHVCRNGQRVGSLIVDDKWAGQWGRDWPEKVWNDMRAHDADFAYIAVNHDALPEESKVAGFGLAPCRRAGVRVWVIDRSNRDLVLGILMDSVDKLLKLAEAKEVYGATSKEMKQLQTYLTRDYETDLREKAKHLCVAIKALNEMHRKVNSEYERAMEALRGYWTTEKRVHGGITSFLAAKIPRLLPQIEFNKDQ